MRTLALALVAVLAAVACGGKTIGDIPDPTGATPPSQGPTDPDPDPDPTRRSPAPTPTPTTTVPPPWDGPSVPPSSPPTPAPCELHTFYRDYDFDGWGDPKKGITACSAPPGYVSNDGDCFDNNGNAYPGQTKTFVFPRGDGSYDYDCDGKTTVENDVLDAGYCLCDAAGGNCSLTEGWRKTVPSCGDTGIFNVAPKDLGSSSCQPIEESRKQACR